MKHLGVVIERRNYYRLLSAVVEAALGRGWRVTCFHDHSQPRTGMKGAEFPALDAIPRFRHGAPTPVAYAGLDALPDAVDRAGIDAVVSLGLPPPSVREGRRRLGARWATLQYHGELFSWLVPPPVLSVDLLGVYSAWWLDAAIGHYARKGLLTPGDATEAALRARARVVGFPELDTLPLIDPDEVRRRWGLAPRRPVVLFLPYPFHSNPLTPWSRWAYRPGLPAWRRARLALGGHGRLRPIVGAADDPALVRALRAFCDASGAALVVKARAKDPIPRHVRRAADFALYDEQNHPPTILEALAIASLCVHFYSTAVFEAVGAGVPSLCLVPEPDHLGLPLEWQEWFYSPGEGGFFNFPGASETLGIPQAIATLPRRGLDAFRVDPAARGAYVAKFLTSTEGKSARTFLDLVDGGGGAP